ncbi:gpr180 [Symbiodinium sp. CCMP2456]|nr:gpr180 [Symbiodinium sp. CCMP2456]
MTSLQHAQYGSGHLGRSRQKATLTRSRRVTQRTRLRAPVDAVEADDSFFNTGLRLQEASQLTVLTWLAFQLLSLVLQWQFWQEVRTNLDLFGETLAVHCAQDVSQHGVCHGPIWNVSAWHEFVLHGKPSRLWHAELPSVHLRTRGRLIDSIPAIDAEIAQLEQETANRLKQLRERRAELMVLQGLMPAGLNHSVTGRAFNSTYIFQFETRSSPPVFLLSLNPIARSHRVGEMPPTIVPSDDAEGSDLWPWSLQVRRLEPTQAAADYQRFGSGEKVITIEDQSVEAVSSVRQKGYVRWEVMVQSSDLSGKQTRFDAAGISPSMRHGSGAGSLQAVYWRALRAQHDPPDLDVELSKAPPDDTSGCCGFQAIILVKLVVMDVPQQVCIVLYLLGWYEQEGLRCQLCLFHPQHCEPEHPFRLANSAAFLCTLLSSVANQIIIGPSQKHKASGESGAEWIVRIGLLCVSILPFTTGVYWATSALVWTPVLARILFFLPCVIGWFCIFATVLSCLVACCAEAPHAKLTESVRFQA